LLEVWERLPLYCKMSMVGPPNPSATIEVEEDVDGRLPGVLLAGPAAATTEVEEDVDGSPPRGCYRRVRQRPPPRLKRTSMTGPLGGAADRSGSGHH
jgi:hypothetical protein